MNKSTSSLTTEELIAWTFSYHLENKARELEKKLLITKEEFKVEREEELEAEMESLKKPTS
nr:15337_t:CDS:2 [Entrophospora candida]